MLEIGNALIVELSISLSSWEITCVEERSISQPLRLIWSRFEVLSTFVSGWSGQFRRQVAMRMPDYYLLGFEMDAA